MNYEIILTREAKASLKSLDVRTRSTIARRIESLKESPDSQRKALYGSLTGYRSVHVAGRYRVLTEVERNVVTVVVVAVGIRKEGSKIDVYETLKKLLRSKVFE